MVGFGWDVVGNSLKGLVMVGIWLVIIGFWYVIVGIFLLMVGNGW